MRGAASTEPPPPSAAVVSALNSQVAFLRTQLRLERERTKSSEASMVRRSQQRRVEREEAAARLREVRDAAASEQKSALRRAIASRRGRSAPHTQTSTAAKSGSRRRSSKATAAASSRQHRRRARSGSESSSGSAAAAATTTTADAWIERELDAALSEARQQWERELSETKGWESTMVSENTRLRAALKVRLLHETWNVPKTPASCPAVQGLSPSGSASGSPRSSPPAASSSLSRRGTPTKALIDAASSATTTPLRGAAALELAEQFVRRGGGGGSRTSPRSPPLAQSKAKQQQQRSATLTLAREVISQRKHLSALKWRSTNLQKQLQKERAARSRLEARLARAERLSKNSSMIICEGYRHELTALSEALFKVHSTLRERASELQGNLRVLCRVRPFIASADSPDLAHLSLGRSEMPYLRELGRAIRAASGEVAVGSDAPRVSSTGASALAAAARTPTPSPSPSPPPPGMLRTVQSPSRSALADATIDAARKKITKLQDAVTVLADPPRVELTQKQPKPVRERDRRKNGSGGSGNKKKKTQKLKNLLQGATAAALSSNASRPPVPPISFSFSHVVPGSMSQADVFERAKGIALSVRTCKTNVIVFAYGGTGSGKTYTMAGEASPPSKRGLYPRVVASLFAEFEQPANAARFHYKLVMRVADNYLREVRDLLDPSPPMWREGGGERMEAAWGRAVATSAPPTNKASSLRKHANAFNAFAPVEVQSVGHFYALLRFVSSRRVVGQVFHEQSSRSHMAIALTVSRTPRADAPSTPSKHGGSGSGQGGQGQGQSRQGRRPRSAQLLFVDLAGSERFKDVSERLGKRSDAAERKGECLAITKSLSALKATMEAIRGAQSAAAAAAPLTPGVGVKTLPYSGSLRYDGGGGGAEAITSQLFRGENLTMLLRYALTPSARNPSPKILMICCVAACARWRRMSIDSLRFATECTRISLKSSAEQAANGEEIKKVKRQLAFLDAAHARARSHLTVTAQALRGSGGQAAEQRIAVWTKSAQEIATELKHMLAEAGGDNSMGVK